MQPKINYKRTELPIFKPTSLLSKNRISTKKESEKKNGETCDSGPKTEGHCGAKTGRFVSVEIKPAKESLLYLALRYLRWYSLVCVCGFQTRRRRIDDQVKLTSD